MPTPSDLPAILLRRAVTHAEEPWLFRPEGWDWIWHPWKEVAGWVDAWAGRLAGRPPGTRAAFLYDGRPEAVGLDLAIQAAGLTAMPVARKDEAGTAEWIEPPPPGLLSQSFGASVADPHPRPLRKAGGAFVQPGEEWTAERIVAAASGMAEAIGESGKREIIVLGGPLGDPLERTMLAWATLTGAAVVLDPAARVATAAWVRPTVFHGTAAEIAELRQRVAKRPPRFGSRLPFRRLRTLVAADSLPGEEEAFWTERGVRIVAAKYWPT